MNHIEMVFWFGMLWVLIHAFLVPIDATIISMAPFPYTLFQMMIGIAIAIFAIPINIRSEVK